MNTTSFFESLVRIQDFINQNNYLTGFNQLKSHLDNYYRQRQPVRAGLASTAIPQIKAQIKAQCDQLILSYNSLVSSLDDVSTSLVFYNLGISHINDSGVTDYLKLLVDEIDAKYNVLRQDISSYNQKLTHLNQLNNISKQLNLDKTENGKKVEGDGLSIHFREGASIEFLDELSKASHQWKQIIHCFGRLTDDNDYKSRIEKIEKGSLIMTITVATGIVIALSKATNSVLDSVLKYHELKKKTLELQSLKLDNIQKAILILEKQSVLNVKNESDRIAKSLMEEYNIEDPETETALRLSISRLINFINRGGKLEPILVKETLTKNKDLVSSIISKNQDLINVEEKIKDLKKGEGIIQLENNTIVEQDD